METPSDVPIVWSGFQSNVDLGLYFPSPAEYSFELRQIFQQKWVLRQHLRRLRVERDSVKYLDGASRGKPVRQWDTSIDDVTKRHARAAAQLRLPKRHRRFQGAVQPSTAALQPKNPSAPGGATRELSATFSPIPLYEPETPRLLRVVSKEPTPSSLGARRPEAPPSEAPPARPTSIRLPSIYTRSVTKTEFSSLIRPSVVRHDASVPGTRLFTTGAMPKFYGANNTLSRSLTEVKDLRLR